MQKYLKDGDFVNHLTFYMVNILLLNKPVDLSVRDCTIRGEFRLF
jgi:hypothetical protein